MEVKDWIIEVQSSSQNYYNKIKEGFMRLVKYTSGSFTLIRDIGILKWIYQCLYGNQTWMILSVFQRPVHVENTVTLFAVFKDLIIESEYLLLSSTIKKLYGLNS